MSVKHAKQSGLPADGGDTSVVQPSDWYADHDLGGVPEYQFAALDAATMTPGVPVTILSAPAAGELVSIVGATNITNGNAGTTGYIGLYCTGDGSDYTRGYIDGNGWNPPGAGFAQPNGALHAVLPVTSPQMSTGGGHVIVTRVTPVAAP